MMLSAGVVTVTVAFARSFSQLAVRVTSEVTVSESKFHAAVPLDQPLNT